MIFGQQGMGDGSMHVAEFFSRGCSSVVFSAMAQQWHKPAGINMVYIWAMGGGGGGGGGYGGAAGGVRGGGGGGGCAGTAKLLVPAFFLPDTLYIIVGTGGAGGLAAQAGSPGLSSYVALSSETNNGLNNLIISCGSTKAAGGSPGTGSAGGAGGVAASISTITIANLAQLGLFSAAAGSAGGNGGNGTGNGVDISWGNNVCSAGCGGGGISSSNFPTRGGYMTGSSLISYHPIPPSSVVEPASHGYNMEKPFLCAGGNGGYPNVSGTGSDGGIASFGSGGGGGGAGTNTGGAGGKGGDGYVLIVCW